MANENNNTLTVTIELSEYMALIQCVTDFELLRKTLYKNAYLSYNQCYLRLNEELISEILSLIDTDRFNHKIDELKAAETEA